MKNTILKRIVSLFIVILMLSTTFIFLSTNVNAADNIDERIYEVIYFESLDKEMIENPYQDLSTISIGNAILAYRVENGQAVETSAEYIPIFSNSKLVSIAIITFLNNEINTVEITNDLVDDINKYEGNKIALIFDNINTYVLCQNKYEVIKTYKNEITVDSEKEIKYKDAVSYLQVDSIKQIETQKVSPVSSFSMSENKKEKLKNSCTETSEISLSSTNNIMTLAASCPPSFNLSVPIISQDGLPICWAAAVASIGKMKTGTKHTAEYVSSYIYGDNRGGNTYVALLALQGIYGLNGVDLYFAPSFDTIKSEIYDDSDPIYVRLYGTSSSGTLNHALTFIGYCDFASGSTYDGQIRYNDTNETSYEHLYFTTSGSYQITYNDISSYIDQYIEIH